MISKKTKLHSFNFHKEAHHIIDHVYMVIAVNNDIALVCSILDRS